MRKLRDKKKAQKRLEYIRQDDHYDEKMAIIAKWKRREITVAKVKKYSYMAAEVRTRVVASVRSGARAAVHARRRAK